MRHNSSDHDPIPDTGKLYETRDVALNTIGKWVFFLFAFLGFSAVAAWVIYKVMVPGGEEASQFPLPHVRQLPPNPRLQANPVQDIKDYRFQEQKALSTYGRDRTTGAIHIPVDRAIDLTLDTLPIRPGAGTIPLGNTTAPNVPSRTDGQAEGRQDVPAGGTQDVGGPGSPGMNPAQSTSPTAVAPGGPAPAIPGGNHATSGGNNPGPVAAPSGGRGE